MTETIEALFDGVVLRPTEPLTLKPNTRVWIVVETTPPLAQKNSFLRTARSLNLDGPEDWSANFKKYQL